MLKRLLVAAILVAGLLPHIAWACACGCGVFDVGTGTMMPTDSGGTVWLEYDFMNQVNNWSNASQAPKANNDDKVLRSEFFQFGGQYMFNREWGVEGSLPFTNRFFKTTDDDTGEQLHHQHAGLGDVHIQAIYSGFEEGMSTGVTFGFKLPTGDFRYSGFDRDTSTGSGSTDLLLGFYHMDVLSSEYAVNWFINGQWDHAFLDQADYRPGDETDAALGIYRPFTVPEVGKISPLLQFIGSYRVHDTGLNANAPNSGYARVNISPGIEYDVGDVKLYGDLEFPIYQNVNGNQIVAPVYAKFILGYSF